MSDAKVHMPKPLDTDESDFVEYMGLTTQADGQSRTLGRIWALLMVREGPLDADTVSDLLRVSKGSISTNIRTLISLNLVERRSMPGERRDFYALTPDPYVKLIESQIAKMSAQEERVRQASEKINGAFAKRQLKELATFYQRMGAGYTRGLQTEKDS